MPDKPIRGYWWIPDSPHDRIAGTLSFPADEGASIELFSCFGDEIHPSQERVPIIYGIALGSGAPITLEDCRFRNQSGTTTYSCFRVFKGAHIEHPSENIFFAIDVSLTHLCTWLGQRAFTFSFANNDAHSPMVACKKPAPVKVSLLEYDVSLEHGISHLQQPFRIELEQDSFVRVSTRNPSSIDCMLRDIIDPVRHFLDLATNQENQITWVVAYHASGEYTLDGVTRDLGSMDCVTIYCRHFSRKPKPTAFIASWEMLFRYEHVQTRLVEILNKLLHLKRDTGAVLAIVLESMMGDIINVDTAIVKLASALECLHRSTALDVKGRLPSKLTLKWRVRDTIDIAGKTAAHLLGEDQTEFAQRIVATRNHLAHMNQNQESRILKGVQQFRCCEALAVILKTAILRHLGFSDSECLEMWSQNSDFNFLCGRFDEVAREWRKEKGKSKPEST